MQLSSCSLLILAFLPPTTFVPCLWDHDTIEMERNKFPEANELIAGYFVRHTDLPLAPRVRGSSD